MNRKKLSESEDDKYYGGKWINQRIKRISMEGDCNLMWCSQRRHDRAFKQKLEAGKGRDRLVLEEDHSGQKEEQVQNTERWNMFKEQTKGHCGWMEMREVPSMDEDSDHVGLQGHWEPQALFNSEWDPLVIVQLLVLRKCVECFLSHILGAGIEIKVSGPYCQFPQHSVWSVFVLGRWRSCC